MEDFCYTKTFLTKKDYHWSLPVIVFFLSVFPKEYTHFKRLLPRRLNRGSLESFKSIELYELFKIGELYPNIPCV